MAISMSRLPRGPVPVVLWWPPLFEMGRADHDGEYFDMRLLLLRDLSDHCGLALTDTPRRPPSALLAAVKQWPENYRKRAYELLAHLTQKRRWIVTTAASGHGGGCEWAWGTMTSADGIVLPRACGCVQSCLVGTSPRGVSASDYWGTSWRLAMTRGSIAVTAAWSADELERYVWAPILRHATSATIIDRNVGRSVKGGHRERYADGLYWLAEVWHQADPSGRQRNVKVITAGNHCDKSKRGDAEDQDRLAQFLGEVRAVLSQWPWLTIEFDLRREVKENPSQQLPHDRWLHTDQGVWLVGRGLDLFTGPQRRAATSSYHPADEATWQSVMADIDPLPRMPYPEG